MVGSEGPPGPDRRRAGKKARGQLRQTFWELQSKLQEQVWQRKHPGSPGLSFPFKNCYLLT
jgi:hypothetical protein